MSSDASSATQHRRRSERGLGRRAAQRAERGRREGRLGRQKNVAHVVRAVPPATIVRCHRQQQQQQLSFLLPSNGYTTRLGSGSAGSAPLRTRSRFLLVVHDDDPSCILRLPKARDSRATRWRRSSRSSHSLNIHHHHHHLGYDAPQLQVQHEVQRIIVKRYVIRHNAPQRSSTRW